MNESHTPFESVGEFGLIDRIAARLPAPDPDSRVICGIGDDAAVYRTDSDLLQVITTDALLEGIHFDRTFTPMPYLGSKAIAVNVSDIAAMNAVPRTATIALGVPRNMSVEMIESIYDGIVSACEHYHVELVGGDTTAAHALYLSVAMTGEVAPERVVFRRGANPGDRICVTGDLGGAFAGLKILLDQRKALEEMGESYIPDLDAFRYVINRQLLPQARMDIVEVMRREGVKPTSMIDISDGIASEIHHICRQSGTGATISIAALPFDPETRAVADQFMEEVDTYAMFGGEDYELLFTTDDASATKLEAAGHCAVVGTIEEADEGIQAMSPSAGLIPLLPAGYNHFPESPPGDGAA